MERKVRVRFAPSPTGALHIGGVRTALYNYLFARQHNGEFIIRIEDTDSTRFVPGAEEYIIDSLRWLGIAIDEGIGANDQTVNDHGPYRQSERRAIYHQYVQQLLDDGYAYYAFDTPDELEQKRKEIPNFQYDAKTRGMMVNSLTLSAEEVAERLKRGDKYVVRFLIQPDEDVTVHDLIRGDVTISSNILDDKVLYKSADDLPTYHLANIVDDHLMEISHVIRGEEWLPSAPLHVLLYRALGWEDTMPQFAHLPLLLKPDGNGKLSKRDGDRLGFPVFALGYRDAGFFPEAVINFLALLGWHNSSDQELFSMDELIAQFSLDRVSKAGAKFDYDKGKWFNHQYLIRKSDTELARLFRPILETNLQQANVPTGLYPKDETVAQVIGLTKDRVNFVAELWEQVNFFFLAPTVYDEKSLAKRWKEDSPRHIQELAALLETVSEADWHANYNTTDDKGNAVLRWKLDDIVMPWIADKGYGVGIVMNAFRICLVGAARGPHIWNITDVLGKEETLKRVQTALQNI